VRRIFVSFHQADELEVEVWRERFSSQFTEIRMLGIPDEEKETFSERIESDDSDYVMRQIRDKYLAGTSCTVVLIGKCTWARRYIDWEIAATLRNNVNDPRGGLIGVQLPNAEANGWKSLPPRLAINLVAAAGNASGYARVYSSAPSDGSIAGWVEEAIVRRDTMEPAFSSTSNLRSRSSSCE
jgi:hypothetical protein